MTHAHSTDSPSPDSPSTEACWLTSSQRSAVAIIVLRGPQATEHLAAAFDPRVPRDLAQTAANRILFGVWRDSGEELVVCRTAAEQWEIHCHGGAAAATHVLDTLAATGVTIVPREQWQMQPQQSPIVNLAWQVLANAPTMRTAAIVLDQARGAWDTEARRIEAWIAQGDTEQAGQAIADLCRWTELGRHLDHPWQVALCGAPNAGKSTLMNRLVGFERSVVWERAGTTRDLVSAPTVIDGWPVELCDTAGLRSTNDPLEQAGVELSLAAVERADLFVEVIDLAAPQSIEFPTSAQALTGVSEVDSLASPRHLRVGNKSDLLADQGPSSDLSCDLHVSAQTGDGVEELLSTIVRQLVPDSPPPGSAVPFASICRQQIERWTQLLHQQANKTP